MSLAVAASDGEARRPEQGVNSRDLSLEQLT